MNNFLPKPLICLGINFFNKPIAKFTSKLIILVIALFLAFQPAVRAQTQIYIDTIGTAGTATYTQSNTASPYIPSANYQFLAQSVSGVSPSDGQYAITNNTNLNNPKGQSGGPFSYSGQTYAWLPAVSNHTTTSGKGYFALINAGVNHAFYQSPAITVVSTDAITISFWALNMISTTQAPTDAVPNFTIVATDAITGAVIATSPATDLAEVNQVTYNTNFTVKSETSPLVWQQFTLKFDAGGHTSIKFQLVDNTGAAGIQVGNDFALDDIAVDEVTCTTPPTPTIGTVTQPTCITGENTGKIAVSNLPSSGTWTLVATPTSAAVASVSADTLKSTGTTATMTGIPGGSYTLSVTNSTGCISLPSSAATISYPDYVWSGATNTVVTLGTNWVGGISPLFAGAESITVPTVSTGNYPTLTSANVGLSVFNLNITGATAVFNLNGQTLNIGCNIVNSSVGGKLTYNSVLNSTINWNGSTAQTYFGNATSATAALGSMTINNSAGSTVTLQDGPVDIYNQLTLTKGNLAVSTNTNTLLTLKSSATQTANVNAITSGYSISGSVNVERYLTGNNSVSYRGYRLLSSPVYLVSSSGTNYLSLNYINKAVGTNMGAFTGGPSTYTGVSPFIGSFSITNPFPTIYVYDESLTSSNATFTSGKNIGVVAIDQLAGKVDVVTLQNKTGVAANIPVGNGYVLYFVGPTGTNAGATPKTAAQNTTMTATGILNQGPINFKFWKTGTAALSYTTGTGTGIAGATPIPGLNMVGNPYPSSIDLAKVYSENNPNGNTTGISSTFYELQEPNMTYISYTVGGHTSSTLASEFIMSGQGFLVAAQNTGQTLVFNEDQKVSTQLTGSPSTPQLLLSLKPTSKGSEAGLHLQLSKDSIINTQTGIYFNSTTSDTYNQMEDAIDLDGIAPQVYLSSYSTDGKRLCINSMGDYIKGKHVKLYVNASATGTYNLGLADISNIDTIFNVFLVDHLLKDSINLRNTKTYNFNISKTDSTTFGANRFELAVDLGALPTYKLLTFTGESISTGAQLNWKTVNESNYTGFVLQKQLANNSFINLDSLQSNGGGGYSYIDNHLSKGVNTYRLKQYGVTGAITYSTVVNVDYDASSVFGAYPNPTSGPININVNLRPDNYNLSIYNSMGGLVKRYSLTGSNWTENISSFTTGTYIMELRDSKGTFIGKTKVVKVQ